MAESIHYIDAKARIVRAINRVTTFVKVSLEYQKDQSHAGNRAKITQMLRELNGIRQNVETDIQVMETAVGNKTAPNEITDNQCSLSLIDSFDSLYYELAAFANLHNMALTNKLESSTLFSTTGVNQSFVNNVSSYQLPKRKFPTFSGLITEWQGFEDLFLSILSHTPDLPDVEKFEYLKTSLEGEALTLIAHLSLTAANYTSAWEILRSRYGNKRDLARVHLDALLKSHVVKSNDATSIKNLLNCILEHTAALDNLGFTTRSWSPILIHIFEKYLDYELRTRWELIVGDKHLPQNKEFVDFLRSHIRSAEVCSYGTIKSKPQGVQLSSKPRYGSSKVLTTIMQPVKPNCSLCKGPHTLYKCPRFTTKSTHERFQLAKNLKLCINCLSPGHSSAACSSKYRCQKCNRSHHSLLHFESTSTHNEISSPSSPSGSTDPPTTSLIIRGAPQHVVLLSTARVDLLSADGRRYQFRALLDSGSQASFITEEAASRLMVKSRYSPVTVTTFSSMSATAVRGKVTVTMLPTGKLFPSFNIDALVVSHITGLTPQNPVVQGKWVHLNHLSLADPTYYTPGPVDILLGADLLPFLLLQGIRNGKSGEPIALETALGWVLMGPTSGNNCTPIVKTFSVTVDESLNMSLRRFWEMEELPQIQHLSPDEIAAEKFYQSTTTRLDCGRFMVKIPFRQSRPLLGESKWTALHRYKALKLRLSRDDALRQQYIEFMKDYLACGHMELVPNTAKDNPYNYYIPHHCVLKPDSQTTKLRVVFNASARTATGQSLNDAMLIGPKLQPSIQVILLRARLWKFVFLTDVKQMYRQIVVHPDDRDYLRILWRFTNNDPINEYRLCTVTYGTAAAPFQALRTVQELAKLERDRWPLAAEILLNDTFVDDILTGADTEDDALNRQSQLTKLCSQAKFELRKWASNSSLILQAVDSDARAMSPSVLLNNEDDSDLKLLGLKWTPSSDSLSFSTCQSGNAPTKRSVLSDIARVFDPLGLLSPITFWTKHIMQLVWTSGIGWDDPLPAELITLWTRYQTEMPMIEQLSIPRRITLDHPTSIQLHAFADSSEKGYAAAVYIRITTSTAIHCHLVIGKSKVAPLKRITIPRLELCGAVLAANLLHFVSNTLQPRVLIERSYAWSDSTTALAWIRSSPHRWATFVANRTSQIQELTSPSMWHHVPTHLNPVDCASRGLLPSEIVNHPLWWTGPVFLTMSSDHWPTLSDFQTQENEPLTISKESKTATVLLITTSSLSNLLDRHSSLQTTIRIIAYCFRLSKHRRSVNTDAHCITAAEMEYALSALIYWTQQSVYVDDISRIKKGLLCSKELRQLDPFIDQRGLIRVGGRLTNANIPYAHKHPILLPSSHRLTALIIDYHHSRLKHPGAHSLQTYLQSEFWIQSAKRVIRSRLRLCIPCFRTRPSKLQPKMAPLPKYRVQQIKPFEIAGVDYAGPITLKVSRGRRSTPTLSYICLFVCLTTKALHLELCSDLSTQTFLMALTRFSARRGPIKEIHSDCGTNFVGAARLLTEVQELTHSKSFQYDVQRHCASNQINWSFNPPSSPHFGGIWEANVKSTKALILRSIGLQKLTSEEFVTLLTQIEATLNSRPLCAQSNDPLDYEALTPSHFLTLQPSTSIPEPNLKSVPLSKLQRWRLITDLHRNFWSRWKSEYLSSLQLRSKWTKASKELSVGELVLIREATHPLHWRLGRIRTLHPGSDGIARVATVDTSTGSLTRPLVKLCPLPNS